MSSAEKFGELIRRVRAGDEDAAAEVFHRYGRIFLKKIKNRLEGSAVKAHVDCEDVCQSVFGSLFLRLRWGEYELSSEEDLVRLLRKLADNKVIAKIRKGAARPDVRGRDDFDVGLAAGQAPTARSLAWVLRREAFWRSGSPRCGVIASVGTLADPGTLLGAPALLQPAFHSPPPPQPAETLVELLKGPLCVGEARRLVLKELGRRYGRPFANQWDFVRFATERKLPLDLLSPPQRPPAPGGKRAIGLGS